VLCLAALAIAATADVGCSRKAIPPPVDGASDADAGGVVDGPAEQGGSGGVRDDGGAVVDGSDDGGMGGQLGNDGGAIADLVSIEVTPAAQMVDLAAGAAGGSLMATATFRAIGHMTDGHTEDVSTRVSWPSSFESLRVSAGIATVRAPGTYTIRATSGVVTGSATLTAIFSGSRFASATDPLSGSALDGAPAAATTIAYPLDHAVLPPNLAPLTVHIARSSATQAMARLRFTAASVLDLSYYALCQPGVGNGCYVDVPLEVTRLFVAVSETQDITLTARVGGTGATLIESAPIQLAWADVPLSGGLYFWTVMTAGVVPGYVPAPNADNTPGVSGSGVWRYAFDRQGATSPELVYTDRGRAPLFQGSPPSTADNTVCIGCHAISGDGKTMAFAVGGSGASDFALLDLTTLNLTVLDAAASAGAGGPTDINYYKQFRRSGVATETTFGPGGDVMVNMYKSQLRLQGANASLMFQGNVAPSWPEYKSDPFWSASGKLFVFTSFATPDQGTYNPTGLNGDMKRGGQIVIASADERAVHDDARMLVPREPNVTRYYPAVSADDQLVIYDESACGLDPDVYTDAVTGAGVYGSQTCDGYDDSSASLWLTTPAGETSPVRLDRLNGGSGIGNSRPQWGPVSGTFRGQRLYWVAFSSRRPYGLQVNLGSSRTTRPQLWLGAVLIGGSLSIDPSSSPLWLPNQNPVPAGGVVNQTPLGNHTPQWTRVAVPIPG
jgi:hypothetical protein